MELFYGANKFFLYYFSEVRLSMALVFSFVTWFYLSSGSTVSKNCSLNKQVCLNGTDVSVSRYLSLPLIINAISIH